MCGLTNMSAALCWIESNTLHQSEVILHAQKESIFGYGGVPFGTRPTSLGEVLNLTRRAVPETRRLAGAKTVHNPTKENRIVLLSPGLFCAVGTGVKGCQRRKRLRAILGPQAQRRYQRALESSGAK